MVYPRTTAAIAFRLMPAENSIEKFFHHHHHLYHHHHHYNYYCERFEPRSHFKSRLSLIVGVNVVLNRTVFVDSDWRFVNLWGSHLQSQSELYHVSWWYYTLLIDLIGQLSRDVIARLSVKPWCYRLWRLVMSLVCFDPSTVTVKQSFIVSQIVSCPVFSWS